MDDRLQIKARLLSRVILNGDCWIWSGTAAKRGYGMIGVRGSHTALTHRLSYELHKGSIPSGALVLHTCDVRRCINPDHLYLGTAKQNTADMLSRDRESFGERSGAAKITEATTDEIFRLSALGRSQRSIGGMVGLSQGQISRILNNKAWSKARRLRVGGR